MSLFDLLGGSGGGLLGSAAGIAGGIMGFIGSSEAAKAESDAANASAAITTFQHQENIAKYTLASRVQQRQQVQQVRNAQMARSQSQAAAVNQGAQYGSALPGAYGGISGAEVSNLQAIGNQYQTYQQEYNAQDQIYGQQLRIAADKSAAISDQGLIQEGSAIAGFGKAAGQLLPSFGTMFGGVNAQATGNDIFSSQGAGAGLGGGL